MINEYILKNAPNNKKVYCETKEQAFEKCKLLYPNTYYFIQIIKNRSFKDFDDFLENKNK